MRYLRYGNVYLVLLLSVLLSGGLFFFRKWTAGIFGGTAIYEHMTMARHIAEDGIPMQEPLHSVTMPYLLDAYDLLLAVFPTPKTGAVVLTLASAMLLPVLVYLLFWRFGASREVRVAATLIFLVSPAYLALLIYPHGEALGVLLLLLAALLQSFNPWASVPLYFVVPFFGPMHAFLGVFTLIAVWQQKRQSPLPATSNLAALVAVSGSLFGLFYLRHGILTHLTFNIRPFFSDMGSITGFGIFAIILALIGFYLGWAEKRAKWSVFLAAFVAFLIAAMEPSMILAFAVPFSLAAALGVRHLVERKWHLPELKSMALLLMVCGILFSSVSFIDEHIASLPDENIQESLQWLSRQEHTGNVLTHPSYAPWVRFMASKTPVIDQRMNTMMPERSDSITRFFQLRNIPSVKNLSSSYAIGTLYITPEMREGAVWNREDEGVLFLLRNNETFSDVYTKSGIEIWGIRPD